jgi:hypothetical protein
LGAGDWIGALLRFAIMVKTPKLTDAPRRCGGMYGDAFGRSN